MIQQDLVDNFLERNLHNFPSNIYSFRAILSSTSYEKFAQLNFHEFRDPDKYLLYSILGGWCGLDRFLEGDICLGLLKLLTGGGFGIWWLVDAVTVRSRIKEHNLKEMCKLLGSMGLN